MANPAGFPATLRAPWERGRSPNPGGRRKGELYISDAVRALLHGEARRSAAPVWDVAENVVRCLKSTKLDSRLLGIVLDRTEGKVPEKVDVNVSAGVVVVPVARLELESWERLASAALSPEPVIDAEVVASTVAALRERTAAVEDEDEEPGEV